MTFKQKIHAAYLQLLQQKLAALEVNMSELNESAGNETKSTAGDKHETALAMLQIEQQNLRNQMAVVTDQLSSLQMIDPGVSPETVAKGSLVETNRGWLYLSAALGKVEVDGKLIMALSPQSPLGMILLGKNIKDIVEINGVSYLISNIE